MRKLKLFFACLLMAVLSIGQVWATPTTASITFEDEGLTNGVQYTDPFEFDDDNVTIVFAGGGNDGKYYDTGKGIRTYGGGTFTVSTKSGKISQAVFTWDGSSYSPSDGTIVDKGTYTTSTGTWEGEETSFTFSRPSGSGHWRLKSVTVTYDGESGGGGGGGSGSETAGTGTIVFGSATGSTNVNSASVTGDDSRGKTWTITTVGTTSFTPNAAYSQIGSGSKPATSITFTTTLSAEMSVTDFSASFGGFSGTAGSVTLKVGTTTVATGSLSGTSNVTVGGTLGTAQTGTELTVTVTGISKGVKAYSISYTVAEPGGGDDPTVTSIEILNPPTKNTYYSEESLDLTGIVVKATLSDESVENPVDVSKLITSAIVKSADKLKVEQPITVTYGGKSAAFNITLLPYTPSGAASLIPNPNNTKDNIFTEGIVTRKDPSDWNPSYGNIIYWISEDGTIANELEVYRGKDLSNEKFASFDDLKEGDKVIVFGNLKNFSGTKEYQQNNYLVSHTERELSSLAISGDLTETSYNIGATELTYTGLTVNATYQTGYVADVTGNVVWSIDPATLSTAGDDIAVTITASYTENAVNKTASKNVTVSVSDKTLTSITIPDAYSANIYCGQSIPKPTVTAHFDDASSSDVTDASTLSEVNVLEPGDHTVTISYTYGEVTKTAEFELTVKAYSVAEIQSVIPATGEISTSVEGVIRWINYIETAETKGFATYSISATGSKDDADTLLIYNSYAGKSGESYTKFTEDDEIELGDKVVVSGKFLTYVKSATSTKETKAKESYISSLTKKSLSSLAISGSLSKTVYEQNEDIDVDGLVVTGTYDTGYQKDITSDVTWTSDPEHLSVVGESVSVHLTATLGTASDAIDVNVKVTAPATKYAISFDGNGNTGGSAPEFASEAAAGANITLPANTYTKTNHTFTGWKVYDENEDEVTVTAGAFTMPALPVTIKAQWAELPVWAYTYTSNVTLSGAKVKFYGEETEYDAVKAGTSDIVGSTSITVPAQASKLHFHAYGWKGETVGLTVTAPAGVTVSPATEISINSNTGMTSNSPFTLAEGSEPKTDAYYVVELSGNDDEIELTFSATSGKRFVLFGVNQEGGVEPELDHITITGELTNKDYELGDELDKTGLTVTAYYTLAGAAHHDEDVTSDVVWSNDPLTGGQTSVDVTATYEGKTDTKACAINAVVVPDPEIILSEDALDFSGKQYGVIASKTFNVTLKNVAAATVALSGDDAAKFSVDPTALTANGTVTVSVPNTSVAGSFSATITVSDDASAATAQTVALTLTLDEEAEAPAWSSAEWVEATELYDGMPILITGMKDAATYAMGVQNNNNRAAVLASVNGAGVLTPGAGTKQFTLEVVDAENSQYAIRTSDGKYLFAASSSSNYLRTQNNLDGNATWTLSVTSAVANGTNTRKMMQFNSDGSGLFACYATSTTTQKPIKLYTPKTYTRDVTEGKYGTICLPNGGVMTNATIYTLAYFGETSQKFFFDEVLGGVMEAGKPYLFLPNDGVNEIKVVYTDAAGASAQTVNGFVGFIGANEDDYTPVPNNEKCYIIQNNTYRQVLAGAEAYIKSYRAYIDRSGDNVPLVEPAKAPGARRIGLGKDEAQGFENIESGDQPKKVMIDGTLYIIRGEKVYNANGQVVK